MTESPRIEEIAGADFTPDVLRAHARYGKPLIVRGSVAADTLFDFSRFQQAMAGREVTVREFGPPPRVPKWQWRGYGRWFTLPLAHYVRMLENGLAASRDIYLGQMAIADHPETGGIVEWFDQLALDFGLRRLYDDMQGNLWIGPPGHVEPLHSDEGDGTLLQLAGRKHVSLFPPAQLHNLYPFPLFGKVAPWVSRVELERPDFVRFPKMAEALRHRIEGIIGPGDLLFIPTQWSHEVTTLDDGVVVISSNRLWRIRPWRRNFCTSRAAVWYIKRCMPRRWTTALHASLSAWRAGRSGEADVRRGTS